MSNLSTSHYAKLKTNLRLAIQRLKLATKKKTEMTQKSRKEIADYLKQGKVERARIRAEHVIHEDYLVEAMDIVEMYCDTVLTRFGMLQQMRSLDEGLSEAVYSLLWATPRLQMNELNVVCNLLTAKYGTRCAIAVKENPISTSVNQALMLKLGVQAPPKALVERYLIEIAYNFGVSYKPDEDIISEDERYRQHNRQTNNGGSSTAFPSLPLIDFGTSPTDLFSTPLLSPIGDNCFNQSDDGNNFPPNLKETTLKLNEEKREENPIIQPIVNLDDYFFPPVPCSSESAVSIEVDTDRIEAAQHGNDEDDHFEDIKRRFAALKMKK